MCVNRSSISRRSCSLMAPGWQVIVGTADAAGPRWRFRAELLLESPMREFATPKDDMQWDLVGPSVASSNGDEASLLADSAEGQQPGNKNLSARKTRLNSIAGGIDIAVLRLTEHILVHGIDKAKNNQHYVFEDIEVREDLSFSASSGSKNNSLVVSPSSVLDSLPRFGDHASQGSRTLDGKGWSFRPHIKAGTTQLRLLGYPPDAGGYDMSILTTWLTGVDFEDRVRSQGRGARECGGCGGFGAPRWTRRAL